MYGKFFASTFTGSMFGAGADIFALWGYVIANTVEGCVELNPVFLAAVLGMPAHSVESAVVSLCSRDTQSRTPDEDGRRLIHEGAFQYRVVNHARYRALRNEEDRRAYNREAKRKERAVKRSVNDKHGMSAHTEAEAEAEADTKDQKHGSRESSARPTPAPRAPSLVNGRSARAHASHAWCGQRLCVAHFLHDELLGKRGGPAFHVELEHWYRATEAEFDGQPIGDRVEDFWRNRFAETWPPVTSRPSGRESVTAQAIRAGNDYLRSRKVDA